MRLLRTHLPPAVADLVRRCRPSGAYLLNSYRRDQVTELCGFHDIATDGNRRGNPRAHAVASPYNVNRAIHRKCRNTLRNLSRFGHDHSVFTAGAEYRPADAPRQIRDGVFPPLPACE